MSSEYTPRIVDRPLQRRMQHHPAVLLVGPRASGKTTTAARFARTALRLDRPQEAAIARADPDAAIRDLEEPLLIDEWQIVPEILGAVKRAVDEEPRPGRFLVTGSVRGEVNAASWPGTGRLLRVPFYGLTVAEVRGHIPTVPFLDRLSEGNLDVLANALEDPPDLQGYAELATQGGFPEPVLRLPATERSTWLDSYIDQLLNRDVAELSARPNPQRLRKYLETYALNTAGVVNQYTLNQAAGIAKATGESYDALLRNLLIADAVPAWWSNRLKRLTKASKRYVIDPSLALATLRVDTRGLMRDGDLLGRMLDTIVVAQLRAELPCCETRPRIFHLRQEQGRHETDLLVEYGGGRVLALEVKATSAPKRRDARHLIWLRDALGERFLGGVVLHTGPRPFELDDNVLAAPIATLWA